MTPYGARTGWPGSRRDNVHAYGVPDVWYARESKRRETRHRFQRRYRARARRLVRRLIASETENYYESLELDLQAAIDEFYEHYCA